MKKWLQLVIGSILAVGLLTGCGEKDNKAPAPVDISIGSVQGSLQKIVMPKIEYSLVTSLNITGTDKKVFATIPLKKDKALYTSIAAFDIKDSVATEDKKFFGPNGRLEIHVAFLNRLASDSKNNIFYSNNGFFAFSGGKLETTKSVTLIGRCVTVAPDDKTVYTYHANRFYKGQLENNKYVNYAPAFLNAYAEPFKGGVYGVVFDKSGNMFVSGRSVTNGQNLIVNYGKNETEVMRYGNIEQKTGKDVMPNLTCYAVTNKYVVGFTGSNFLVWDKASGQFLASERNTKSMKDVTGSIRDMYADGDTIVMSVVAAAAKKGDPRYLELYTLKLK